jgi:hypothetical protein
MRARLAVLGATDVECGGVAELDLRSLEAGDVAGAETTSISDENEGRIPMPMAAAAGGADEPLDLGGGREILAGAQRGVGGP